MMTADRSAPAARPRFLAARRRALLLGCAFGAVSLLAAAPERASAQAFQASIIGTNGSVNRQITSGTTETITIGSDTAIINWLPNDDAANPFTFLPAGHVATYQNGVSNSDYVVLNRILSGVPQRFDGTVLGRLQDGAGNITGPGGTILFASPGGIIVGSTAVFDVGNLVLTTLTVVEDGYGNFVQPDGGFAFQGGDANPNAAIVTEAGSQIVANAEGSYVAMVAPRIVHAGSARVNGSIAYIAAEAASFTVNDGLFDIQIDVGSDNAIPIEHSGTSGGPASGAAGDNHVIYMAAVPKNQAITLLLEGSIGFDAAVDASVENGVVVLSAGYDTINGTTVETADPQPGGASILIEEGSFSSDVFAYATDDLFAGGGAGDLDFLGDVSLFARQRARLFAGAGQTVTVAGDALVSAARTDSDDPLNPDVAGGEALAFAEAGGTLSVGGDLTVDASGTGGETGYGDLGDGTGGTAGIYADGGSVVVSGDLNVVADGSGGASVFNYNDAGSGFGGTAYVEATGGGSVTVSGSADVSADGFGGGTEYSSGRPGDGTGGTVSLTADGGSIAISGDASATARGTGGANSYAYYGGSYYGLAGANGTGGDVVVTAANGGALDVGGTATLDVRGFGGDGVPGVDGGVGGAGQGGTISVDVTGATADIGVLDILAGGFGGDGGDGEQGYGDNSAGGAGGDGTGGVVDVDVGAGGTLTVADLFADSVGVGGDGGAGSDGLIDGGVGGAGGTGTGGFIEVRTSGGTIDVTSPTSIVISAIGVGGDGGAGGANSVDFNGGGAGGAGGAAVGGNARLISVAGAINGGAAVLSADAFGGLGGQGGAGPVAAGGTGGRGGDASSGEARITSLGGDIALGDVDVTVNAVGGDGGDGGDGPTRGDGGVGGDGTAGIDLAGFTLGAFILANGEGGSITVGTADIQAIGAGGSGGAGENGGDGGDGTGGTAQFVSLAGTLQAQALVSISTKGLGGLGGSALANGATGGNGGAGGDGDGGFSLISAESGASAELIAADVELLADGEGGAGGAGAFGTEAGGDGGAGGFGTGGTAEIFAGAGTATVGNALVRANGTGGAGGEGGPGGTIDPPSGTGGAGGAGGVGSGGSGFVSTDGGDLAAGNIDLVASGTGGAGGAGGSAETPGASGTDAADFGGSAAIGASGNAGSLAAGDTTVTVEGDSGGSIEVYASGAPAALGSLDVFGRGIDFNATFADGATLTVTGDASFDIDADLFVYTTATGLIDVAGAMTLLTPGDIVHDEAPDGTARETTILAGSYDGNAGGDWRGLGATIQSGDFITILAGGSVAAGTLDAGGAIEIDGTSIELTQATSGGDIDLAATGDILVGTANAGDDFLADAGGAFTADTVTANVGSDIIVTSVGDLTLDNATASGLIDLESTGGSVLSAGLLDAGTTLDVSAAADVDLNDAVSGGAMDLFAGGALDAANLDAGGSLGAGANGAMTIGTASSAFSMTLTAGGAAILGTLTVGSTLFVDANSIDLTSATAGNDLDLVATNDIVVDFAQAGDDFNAAAGGVFTASDVVATGLGGDNEEGSGLLGGSGNIVIDSAGDLRLDAADAALRIDLTSTGGSVLSDGLLDAGGDLSVLAAEDIALTDLAAGNDILLDAPGGAIGFVSGTAGNAIDIFALGDVAGGDLTAGDDIVVTTDGTLTLGTVESTLGDVELAAVGSVTVDALRSGASSSIVSELGDISANLVEANTADLPPTEDIEGFYAVAENGNVAVGAVTADNIALSASGTIGADSLTAIDLVLLFAGGDTTIGSVDTDGLFYLGHPDTVAALGGLEGLDRAAFDAQPQQASGGALTITGTAQAGDMSLAVGGAAALATLIADGDIVILADLILIDSATAGGDIDLDSPGDIEVDFADAGGDFLADAGGAALLGSVTADDIVVESVDALRLDDAQASGLIQLTSTAGDVLSGAGGSDSVSGSLIAGTDLIIDAARDIAIGDAQAGGSIELTAGRDIQARDLNAVQNVEITAGDDIDFRDLTAEQGDVTLVLGGDLDGTGTLTVGSSLTVVTPNDISFAELDVGEDIILTSNEGSIVIGEGTAGRDIILRALVAVEADTLFAARDVDIQTLVGEGDPAIPRTVTVGTVTAGRNLFLGTFGALTADSLVTTGTGTMFAGSSTSIRIGTMDAAGDVELFMAPTSPSGFTIADGRGGIEVGEIDAAGNVNALNQSSGIVFGSVEAGGSITVRTTDQDSAFAAFTAGDLTAGTSILVEANGLATFEGAATAPTIEVASRDIAITDSGSLGDDATELVLLRILSGGGGDDSVGEGFDDALGVGEPGVLGGDEEGEGWTLDQSEADRIVSAVLRVEAPEVGAADAADLLVRDLALDAGRVGRLELFTQGIIRVAGNLLLANAAADKGIAITALERLEVVTPEGSVRVRGAGDLPAGTLTLVSDNVWAVDSDLLAQLLADPNFEGRNEALATNNGEEEPRGYIEAGDVEIFAGETLLVQNTGSDTVFAGITVTGDTLTIVPTGETPLDVYAFGRRINPDGTFVTNSAFFAEVEFEEGEGGEEGYGAGYTETAEFNQCVIATASCPIVIREDPVPGNADIIEETVDGPAPPDIMMDLVDTSFSSDPLIEEPVTSGGDSVLWDCDRDEDGDCDEDDRDAE